LGLDLLNANSALWLVTSNFVCVRLLVFCKAMFYISCHVSLYKGSLVERNGTTFFIDKYILGIIYTQNQAKNTEYEIN